MPTLLVIDDNHLFLSSLGKTFGELEFTVRIAPSAAAGLELLAQQQPDVILLEPKLPDQLGLEVFHQIQQINARVPVIFRHFSLIPTTEKGEWGAITGLAPLGG